MSNGTGFFSNILSGLGNINLGDLASTGLNIAGLTDAMGRLSGIGEGLAEGARRVGSEAQEASQFQPFTITTGFGGVKATPEGGFTTELSPQQQARQDALSGITGGLLGGFTGAQVPDVSGIQRQALEGTTGALTGAMAPREARVADVYERIRATQRPEEERQRIALQEQLQAQGRTGLRTAQFGGAPEQFALAQAQEEAKNRAALAAIQQAGVEREQDLATAQGLFGLGTTAAGLPAALQAAQLQNIGSGLGLEYAPEQQLLSTLTPAISLSDLVGRGARQGAGFVSEAGMSGLEALGQTEIARANILRDLYTSLLSAGGQAASGNATAGLFSDIFGGETLGSLFGSIFGGEG